MKKALLFFAVIFIIQITGFCQNNPLAISKSMDKQTTSAIDKSTYYLIELQADSSIFSLDTLSLTKTTIGLTKTAIDKRFPSFEFDSDSKFHFFYEMNESHPVRDVKTGEMALRIVKKSKTIEGTWKSNDKQKDIRLTLIDKSVINYSIVEGSKFTYFIKVK